MPCTRTDPDPATPQPRNPATPQPRNQRISMLDRSAAPSLSSWRRSSRSTGANNCVEAAVRGPDLLLVRDSKDVDQDCLSFSAPAWRTFVAALRDPGLRP
ncbi:DUF397 domain-containing protein [Streptomyces sp. NBC_00101]|uniref:DUF397 domain-containing protein n=2 Tax=unclassified Streptomyces TaxID=2593676 RepID=UPI00386909FC